MAEIIRIIVKAMCIVIFLLMAYAFLFCLNALRIALFSYCPKPIRKYYKALAAKDDFVPYHKIPPVAEIVLTCAEDYSFFIHHGFSISAIYYAMKRNRIKKFKKADKWGGSCITQQLVKNLYLYPQKTYTRKLAELFLSIWIELRISKRQILELYFNIVYFGKNQYGLKSAAGYYIGVEPELLTLNQLISLICILPNPNCYNPIDNPELFQKARKQLLSRLQYLKRITPEYTQVLSDMPWNAFSNDPDLTILCRFLTKSPCFRSNLKRKDPRYRCFQDHAPVGLMLHSVGCAQSDPSGFLRQWNRRDFNDACVHAFIDANDGTVYQTLPWHFRGWHCGGEGNNTHIGIEMCEPDCIRYTQGAAFEVLDSERAKQFALCAYASAVKLFVHLCLLYHLDSSVIISHSEGCSLGIASDHKDPEHLWAGLGLDLSMDQFRADVQALIDEDPPQIISDLMSFRKKTPFRKRVQIFLTGCKNLINAASEQ